MNLPETFVRQTQDLLKDDYKFFEKSLFEKIPTSIRVNPFKSTNQIFREQVAWCDSGFYLPSRPIFTLDPLFHAGCYYVQEASSMFLEQIINNIIDHPVVCLDLCAAPGGKSTHLSSILPKNSLLVSNEVIRSRAHILAENLTKWGNPSTIVTNNNPTEIGQINHLFDIILADVPCSGEGMFRKDPKSVEEWSPGNVLLCVERQQKIISDIWPALKPGGFLIYSTCTYNTRENEENIDWLSKTFGATPLNIPVPEGTKISGSKKGNYPVYRFFPHLTKGEGFFIAVLQKPEEKTSFSHRSEKRNDKKKNPQNITITSNEINTWIQNHSDYNIMIKGTNIIAIPNIHQEVYSILDNKLRIILAGITLGERKGKDLIPDHALSMSLAFNINSFVHYEVTKEDALNYLRKETSISSPTEFPKGYIALTYENHPLGFIKNIGNRINNLYPHEWRIKMKL